MKEVLINSKASVFASRTRLADVLEGDWKRGTDDDFSHLALPPHYILAEIRQFFKFFGEKIYNLIFLYNSLPEGIVCRII
jgi:hypothetical protein